MVSPRIAEEPANILVDARGRLLLGLLDPSF
jgi:hypothetical protein